MGISELVLIYALNHATWSMNDKGIPQICLRVPVEASEGTSETFQGCTAVPEEILLEWLSRATVRV
jgi:hypothetical protein